jgi:hypothetical protein
MSEADTAAQIAEVIELAAVAMADLSARYRRLCEDTRMQTIAELRDEASASGNTALAYAADFLEARSNQR